MSSFLSENGTDIFKKEVRIGHMIINSKSKKAFPCLGKKKLFIIMQEKSSFFKSEKDIRTTFNNATINLQRLIRLNYAFILNVRWNRVICFRI